MADENVNNNVETNVTENTATETETKTTPTAEELTAQIAQLTAERDKYKNANDKLSKEAAEAKRKERARMTEDERKAEEKAEADRVRDEELETLKKELNHNKAVNAYRAISDESMVETLIDAISEADHSAVAGIIDRLVAAKVKEAQAEWQKSRPRVNIGGGDGGYTKEQFEKMTMAEKSKLYRENKAEYDRLNS